MATSLNTFVSMNVRYEKHQVVFDEEQLSSVTSELGKDRVVTVEFISADSSKFHCKIKKAPKDDEIEHLFTLNCISNNGMPLSGCSTTFQNALDSRLNRVTEEHRPKRHMSMPMLVDNPNHGSKDSNLGKIIKSFESFHEQPLPSIPKVQYKPRKSKLDYDESSLKKLISIDDNEFFAKLLMNTRNDPESMASDFNFKCDEIVAVTKSKKENYKSAYKMLLDIAINRGNFTYQMIEPFISGDNFETFVQHAEMSS